MQLRREQRHGEAAVVEVARQTSPSASTDIADVLAALDSNLECFECWREREFRDATWYATGRSHELERQLTAVVRRGRPCDAGE